MYSRQMVILFVNENGTAEKVGIHQINPQNIWIILWACSFKIKTNQAILNSFESTKTSG